MSRVDERIRREMDGLGRPVPTHGVLDRVAGRKARRRTMHRIGMVALAASVVAGTVLGGYGLSRLFGSPDTRTPASGGSPATLDPRGTQTMVENLVCDSSVVEGDFDGDGVQDFVDVGSPVDPGQGCDSEQVGQSYFAMVTPLGPLSETWSATHQPLPECETPFGCRVIAAPDLNGDGDSEVVIQTAFGASTQYVALYDFNPFAPEGGPPLIRLEIAAPGDPWHEEFGFRPGPALFPRGGSVTHLHSISCYEDAEGNRFIVATTALYREGEGDEAVYDVHVTRFDVNPWPQITVVSSEDLGPASPEVADIGSGEICGAPIE
ncbi:MAG: hypothetical protein HY658_06050 [Actinobacteria bacterium]|nr:hypothetical protein [Actinomycetota bacterium]